MLCDTGEKKYKDSSKLDRDFFTRTTNYRCSSTSTQLFNFSLIIMQFKLGFVVAALATLVVAIPTPDGAPSSDSSTGTEQCCDSTTTPADASPAIMALVQATYGVPVGDLTGLIGLECTSIAGSAW